MQQRGQLGVSPVLPVEALSGRMNEERVVDGELLDKVVHSSRKSSQYRPYVFDGQAQRESHPGFYKRQQADNNQYAIDSYNDTKTLGRSRNHSTGAHNQVDYFV